MGKEELIPRTKKQYMPKNVNDYKSINKIFSVLAFVVATETESREEKHQNDKRKNLRREQDRIKRGKDNPSSSITRYSSTTLSFTTLDSHLHNENSNDRIMI